MKNTPTVSFLIEFGRLLKKHRVTLRIEDTEEIDYKGIPNFGTIYKKVIEATLVDNDCINHYINLGSKVNEETIDDQYNIFNNNNKTL